MAAALPALYLVRLRAALAVMKLRQRSSAQAMTAYIPNLSTAVSDP